MERVRALFGGDPLANSLFLLAIAIGFFHGWIKYKYTGLVSTFAFDLPLTFALVLALARAGATGSWFPPQNSVANGLKLLTASALLYAVLPFGIPMLASFAAFRAWVVIPLIFLLGYHVTRSVRQVEVLLTMVIVLCCVTVYFGARQTPEEIRAMLAANPDLARRLSGTFFANADGGGGLRAFSTFVSAGAFGGTLSTGGICAFAYLTQPGQTVVKRLLFGGALALAAYGINLSGARTAVAMLALGVIITAWSRQSLLKYVVIPGGAMAVVGLGSLIDPARLARFSALLDPAELWGRLSIVIGPGMDEIANSPLGGGLGRSGHGVPYVFANILGSWDVKPVDGDLGRIAVDFGIPGLIVFGVLLWAGIRACLGWMIRLRGSGLHTVVICAAAVFIIAAMNIGTGSPYLGVPGGALTWFLLGAVNRLVDVQAQVSAAATERASSDPRLTPFGGSAEISPDTLGLAQAPPSNGQAPRRRMLYQQSEAAGLPEPRREVSPRSTGRRARRLFGDNSSQ